MDTRDPDNWPSPSDLAQEAPFFYPHDPQHEAETTARLVALQETARQEGWL